MKKILSLVMVVAMLVAVLALVGCNPDKPEDTTAGTTTEGTTTEGTTTEETTTEETTTEETTTESTTTLPPVNARFDFGSESKGDALGMTSHDWLVANLTIDEAYVSVEYTKDSIIVKAVKDHPEITFGADGAEVFTEGGYAVNSYALQYKNLIDYDFDDITAAGNKYARFRIKNNTVNNMMAFRWRKATDNELYASTLLASCFYLQGGAPTIEDYIAGENKLTCTPSEDYAVYTYDLPFLATLGRNSTRGAGSVERYRATSYAHMAYAVGIGQESCGANNWSWSGTNPLASMEFYVLGAYGGGATRPFFKYADSRANIVEGATVEIDYIIFGNTAKDLNTFTSYIQDEYNESVSISKSVAASISESISALEAATATTAAS
jgi:hypothetical protein